MITIWRWQMNDSFVGPFFFIDNKIIALKVDISKGERIGNFINHPKSHFEFFKDIMNDPRDDYGHYPRGRVVYDCMTNQFIIYIDKCLNNKKTKELILSEFKLEKRKCVFRNDSHYTHNWL